MAAPKNGDRDERVAIPLDPKTALKALLATPADNGKPQRKSRKKKPAKS